MVNQASWQETFMSLWFSALRLVQRVEITLFPLVLSFLELQFLLEMLLTYLLTFQDREPWEGPIPHLEARLCILLSIVPLVIVSIVKEELDTACARSDYEESIAVNKPTSRRHGLVSSLQLLMQYTGLLSPPPSVVNAANNAAAKAANFIVHFKNGNSSIGATQKGTSLNAGVHFS